MLNIKEERHKSFEERFFCIFVFYYRLYERISLHTEYHSTMTLHFYFSSRKPNIKIGYPQILSIVNMFHTMYIFVCISLIP